MATRTDLSEREQAILRFEDLSWKYSGAKDQAIREQFGLSPTVYYQLLSRLLDDERAIAYQPMLVRRLRRLRSTNRRTHLAPGSQS